MGDDLFLDMHQKNVLDFWVMGDDLFSLQDPSHQLSHSRMSLLSFYIFPESHHCSWAVKGIHAWQEICKVDIHRHWIEFFTLFLCDIAPILETWIEKPMMRYLIGRKHNDGEKCKREWRELWVWKFIYSSTLTICKRKPHDYL